MDTLQQKFDAMLHAKVTPRLIIEGIIRKKLSAAGLNLSEGEIQKIAAGIEGLQEGETTLRVSDIAAEAPDMKIEIGDEDIKECIEALCDGLRDEYPRIIEETSDVVLKQIKRTARSQVAGYRRDRKKFERRLERVWRIPLRLIELYHLLVLEAGEEFNQRYRPEASKASDQVFDVLTRLHARACQISSEVIVLLKAGHADGAHARWRTLHEVAIVAMFIEKHGQDVANRYMRHEVVESYKGALEYRENSEALGLEPFPVDEFDDIESKYRRVIEEFGPNFKTQYGWAAAALNKARPTFSDIQKDVDLAKWRGHYRMASHNVHANPKGITFKLGLSLSEKHILMAGVSNSGLADPAHGTALSLLQITSTLLFTKRNIDTLVRCRILMELQREIGEEFLKVHNEIEEYESSLRG